MEIHVVEKHHQVLPYWAEYRRLLPTSPLLVSLDHHTDTSPAFRRYLKKDSLSEEEFFNQQNELLAQLNYEDSESVVSAVERLNNDEHITAAIACDIIDVACIVAQNASDTDLDILQEHSVICSGVDRENNKLIVDNVLESDFLQRKILYINQVYQKKYDGYLLDRPYILDIDLDYFNSFKSVAPENSEFIKKLAINAGLITVATEPEYVKTCAVDTYLNSQWLLEQLNELLKS